MNYLIKIFVLISLAAIVSTESDPEVTPSEPCDGQELGDLRERIQVLPCGKTKCKLYKSYNTTVIFKFRPKKIINELINEVYANVGTIPLPFIGVTGQSACKDVSHADTGEPAPCPLQPDHEYVYKNVFYIQPLYPSLSMRVHWSLNDGDEKVICFEVPAEIKERKKSSKKT